MESERTLSSAWDQHLASEFAAKSADEALATMTAEPHVNLVPLMIGARGRSELHDFYANHFLSQIPPDMEMVTVSRTIGQGRVVDEAIMRFTHTIRLDWILPGIPPTGRRVELPFVVIVQFEGDKLAHEHLYWDQASVLVQVGLLDRTLPVRGGETAAQVLTPTQPMNELIRRPSNYEERKPMNFPVSELVAKNSIDRGTFETFYNGKAPWVIGKPQRPFTAIAEQVTGPILDAGCGTGEHALLFAARGHRVTGIDFVEEALRRARGKAAERGLEVEFLVQDALALDDWRGQFASVIDSGMFHGFSDTDRRRYVQGLARVLKPGGRLFLMCFSDEEPGTEGPRRVSKRELYSAFTGDWEVESVRPTRFEVNPEFTEVKFSEGGPKAWLAIIRRKG